LDSRDIILVDYDSNDAFIFEIGALEGD